MHIEIHQPELQALIQARLDSGRFQNVEDLLLDALRTSSDEPGFVLQKENFHDFLMRSPLRNSGLIVERNDDAPEPLAL